MIVVDSGVGRITGFSLSGRQDAANPLNDSLKPLAALDIARLSLSGVSGQIMWISCWRVCRL